MNPLAASAACRSPAGMGAVSGTVAMGPPSSRRPGPPGCGTTVNAYGGWRGGRAWSGGRGGSAMRVAVDRDLCEANGVCAGLAPEVFDLDDEDYLHVLVAEVPPGQHGAVRSAGAFCPKQALRLEE